MTPYVEHTNLDEIIHQSFGLTEMHERMMEYVDAIDGHTFWHFADAVLGCAGKLSHMLWPASKDPDAQARGAYLRRVLRVDDSSPLSDRTVRNHYEHFDERLDAWARRLQKGRFADFGMINDRMIRPYEHPIMEICEPECRAREYDRETGELLFMGGADRVDLRALVKEAKLLCDRAMARRSELDIWRPKPSKLPQWLRELA